MNLTVIDHLMVIHAGVGQEAGGGKLVMMRSGHIVQN